MCKNKRFKSSFKMLANSRLHVQKVLLRYIYASNLISDTFELSMSAQTHKVLITGKMN